MKKRILYSFCKVKGNNKTCEQTLKGLFICHPFVRLYQFLIIAYLFTLKISLANQSKPFVRKNLDFLSKWGTMNIPFVPASNRKIFASERSIWLFCPRTVNLCLEDSWLNNAQIWFYIWATSWQNQQYDLCAQGKLRSAWASTHPPSLIRVFAVRMKKHWVLSYHWAHCVGSDQTGRMSRLFWVHWADRSFGWFCHEAALFFILILCLIFRRTAFVVRQTTEEERADFREQVCQNCAGAWRNQQNELCAQRRLRVDWSFAQILLVIRPVWSVSLLSAWRSLWSLAIHRVHREDIWVFTGRTGHYVGFVIFRLNKIDIYI